MGRMNSCSPIARRMKAMQQVTSGGCHSDTQVACLNRRISGIGKYTHRSPECRFDFIERDTVLLALVAAAVVSVETDYGIAHLRTQSQCMYNCTYTNHAYP